MWVESGYEPTNCGAVSDFRSYMGKLVTIAVALLEITPIALIMYCTKKKTPEGMFVDNSQHAGNPQSFPYSTPTQHNAIVDTAPPDTTPVSVYTYMDTVTCTRTYGKINDSIWGYMYPHVP